MIHDYSAHAALHNLKMCVGTVGCEDRNSIRFLSLWDFTHVGVQMVVFWAVTSHSIVTWYTCFKRTFCTHRKDQSVWCGDVLTLYRLFMSLDGLQDIIFLTFEVLWVLRQTVNFPPSSLILSFSHTPHHTTAQYWSHSTWQNWYITKTQYNGDYDWNLWHLRNSKYYMNKKSLTLNSKNRRLYDKQENATELTVRTQTSEIKEMDDLHLDILIYTEVPGWTWTVLFCEKTPYNLLSLSLTR
jgi:hypothetical protein